MLPLRGKDIIVTSGGTREYIDDVRVMTNISTGKLGAIIAQSLYDLGATVHYIHGVGAKVPSLEEIHLYPVSSANDLLVSIKRVMSSCRKMDSPVFSVIHAMAVSDFSFKRDSAVKCKSDSAEDFIEYMRRTIIKNPKIISQIKNLEPSTVLVGFKFEVGADISTLADLAHKSIERNGCDLVVTNDKVEMVKNGEHIAHLFFSDRMHDLGFVDLTVYEKDKIADHIAVTLSMLK